MAKPLPEYRAEVALSLATGQAQVQQPVHKYDPRMHRGGPEKTRQAFVWGGNSQAGEEADRLDPCLGNHGDLSPSW